MCAVALAARHIRLWAEDSAVTEDEAAPVVTEAARLAAMVLEHYDVHHAPTVSKCAQEELRAAILGLKGLLHEADLLSTEEPTSVSCSTAVTDGELTESHFGHTVTTHMCVILSILMVILLVAMIMVCFMADHHLDAYTRSSHEIQVTTLLHIAVVALTVNFPQLLEEHADVKYASRPVVASILTDLTFPTVKVDAQWRPFYDANEPLYEFWAGTTTIINRRKMNFPVVSHQFPRLCRENETYPLKPSHDVASGQVYTVPALVPFKCSSSESLMQAMRYASSHYSVFSPRVETYRRNTASSALAFIPTFGTSIAAKEDYDKLQDLVAQSTLHPPSLRSYVSFDSLRGSTEMWIVFLFIASGFVLTAVLLATVLVPRIAQYPQLVALVMSVLILMVTLGTQQLAEEGMRLTTKEAQLSRVKSVSRCLRAALTSPTMEEMGTIGDFLDAITAHLNERILFITKNSDGDSEVFPASMEEAAKAIDALYFSVLHVPQQSGCHNGYCYGTFYDSNTSRTVVYVEPASYEPHVPAAAWIAAGAGAISFFFVYAYLRLSPLKNLATAGRSPPLQRLIAPQHLRYVLYLMMLVIVVGAMIALNAYGASLVNAATEQLSKETLQVLGSTIRSPRSIDTCIKSCGLPNTIVLQSFDADGAEVTPIDSKVPYPMPAGDWVSHYFGAQLAMSKLPTVLENALSFSTPLVNRTSGYIEPRYLQHRMLASVDVNETFGFVLERLPSSTRSPTYAFVSQSIGLCLALGAVCIGVCVLEWLYTRMGRLQRERKSLLSSYVIMVVVVLLVSSMLMVNVAIMKSEMHRAIVEFAHQELSSIARVESSLLEHLTLSGEWSWDSISSMASLLDEFSEDVRLSVGFPMKYTLLDVSPDGAVVLVTRVNGVEVNVTLPFTFEKHPSVLTCGSWEGSLWPSSPVRTMVACASEVATPRQSEDQQRLFAVVLREYDGVVKLHHHDGAFVPFAILSGCVTVVLCGWLMMILWYSMREACLSVPVASSREEVQLLEWNASGQSDSFCRRHPRVDRSWFYWMVGGASLVLALYSVTVLFCVQDLIHTGTIPVPLERQDDVAVALLTSTLTVGFNYMIYPNETATAVDLNSVADCVVEGCSPYIFARSSTAQTFSENVRTLSTSVLSTPTLGAYRQVELSAEGYDSYESLIAAKYASYAYTQEMVLNESTMLLGVIELFLEMDVTQFKANHVPGAVQSVLRLHSALSTLYALDMMAVQSFLVFTTKENDNTNWDLASDPQTIVGHTLSAYQDLSLLVKGHISEVLETGDKLMSSSKALYQLKSSVEYIRNTFVKGCALSTTSSDFWRIQRQRVVEHSFVGNATKNARIEQEEGELVHLMNSISSSMLGLLSDDLNYKKGVELVVYTDEKRSLDRLQEPVNWQVVASFVASKRKLHVASVCALTLFVLIVIVGALWHTLQRHRRKQLQLADDANRIPGVDAGNAGLDWSRYSQFFTVPLCAAALLVMCLVPMCCASWLTHCLIAAIGDESVVEAVTVIQRQASFVQSARFLMYGSAIGFVDDSDVYTEFLADLLDAAKLFRIEFLSKRMPRPGSQLAKSVASFETKLDLLAEACEYEMDVYSSHVPFAERKDLTTPQSSYSLSVLASMSADDDYAIVNPMSALSEGPVKVLSNEIYAKSMADAGDQEFKKTSIFAPSISWTRYLVEVTQAYVLMLQVSVCASAFHGETFAVKHSAFGRTVSPESLQALRDSKLPSATSGVAAISDFYAPLLAVASTSDAVMQLFTGTEAPSIETGPVSAYINAAFVCSYLSSITTTATFANLYAYNRGLTNTSSEYPVHAPIITILADTLSSSRYLITSGLSTPSYVYTIQPPATNKWIWSTVVEGTHIPAGVLTDVNYLQVATQWCLVSAFLVIALTVFVFAWKTEYVEGMRVL